MFIALEGIDKCGKTSLARYISKRNNFPIVKFSQPKGDPYLEYMGYLCKKPKKIEVLDRFFLGELAYGPVKRGKSSLSPTDVRNIELMLMAQKPLLIYCSTDNQTIESNFRKDNETFTKVSEIKVLKELFSSATTSSLNEWKKFDYKKDLDYRRVTAVIDQWVKETEVNLSRLLKLRDQRVIGNTDADTLLVGDVCNPTYKTYPTPFAYGPSSEYLHAALSLAGIEYKSIAITNFTKCHNKTKGLKVELKNLQLKKILYLGPIKDIPNKLDVQHIRHPSWAARFNHPLLAYANELKVIIKK